ncbi:MAG: S-layer homology domain-containing protein [Ruminococcaceae bacterium]|nr:S-layer homology domain-containing protein [Oscillospiraceae bacterium]
MKNSKRIMAMVFAVIMGALSIFSVSAFNDVSVEHDAYEAISTLTALGVIHGKTETEYAPEDLVTREEFAALVYRLYTTYSNEGGQNLTPFTDLTDPFYNTMISWCYDQGVVDGTTPTTFEPSENIIYQDALTMVTRLIGYKNLSYPLGYITKARTVGLTEGLEGIAFDKLLTRGEMAKILYNALEAPNAQEVKETIYFENFPITTTRPFTIAEDIYNFKKITYQIVGTENFNLDGYNKSGEKNAYYLAEVNAKGEVSNKGVYYDFDELEISEDVESDDNILGYLRVMSRGKIGEKNSIVLGSVITSALDTESELEVAYDEPDKNTTSSTDLRNPELISVNGKHYNVHEIVYTVSDKGVIAPIASDKDLSEVYPVFYSGNGKYAQQTIDLDNDGKDDIVLIFEMSFKQIKDITSKGAYILRDPDASQSETIDEENILLNTEAEEKDYVLVYNRGGFTVIEEVVEPEITNVASRRGTGKNTKYTLGNGMVVTYATANNPVKNIDHSGKYLTVESAEKAIYVVNDKVLYSTGSDAIGYNPYSYAFIINEGDSEVSVDPETGAVQNVNNFIGFMNGKAVTMPIHEKYEISLYIHRVVTITDAIDGKYVLYPEIIVKDEEHEIKVNGNLEYDRYTGLYKIDGKYINLDENSEVYVAKFSPEGEYESVKRYTKVNMPENASGKLQSAVLRKNENSSVYTLVVAYLTNGDDFAGSTQYTGNRIVLSHGTVLDNGKTYKTYDVLNVFTGTIETITDAYVAVDDEFFAIGSVVRQAANGSITLVSDADQKFESLNNATAAGLATIGENGVYDGNVVFIDGAERSVTIGNTPIFKLSIDENEEYVVEQVDAEEMQGQTIRTYTSSSNNYKMYYAVILPEEWFEVQETA